ncbi:MAG: TldD/PmbA family protein [Planctomycetes bacterium]|nr:TldD/PmbA family protein [Planctomycetota bacterium]
MTMDRRQFLKSGAAAVGAAWGLSGCRSNGRVLEGGGERAGRSDVLKEVCDRILNLSAGEETAVRVTEAQSALTRFANNTIHQNVSESYRRADVTLVQGRKVARVWTNRFDENSLRVLLERGIEMARRQQEIDDYMPMPGPQRSEAIARYDRATAQTAPEDRAALVAAAVEATRKLGLTAAGFLRTSAFTFATANSKGLFAAYPETRASCSITALGGNSSGWAQGVAPALREIDPEALAERAAQKAIRGRDPEALEPGRVTVVLEAAAVADLLSMMLSAFDARRVLEKRSFFAGKSGQKLFGENITIEDDASHRLHMGAPFDGEGIPRTRVKLVDRGVLESLVYDRPTAAKMNARPTGHSGGPPEYGAYPSHVVLRGGSESLDQLIEQTDRGVLVTHFWYIRFLDAFQLTITGMTRDGTFRIENGKIVSGLKNMRFNISIPEILNRVEALGPEERASGIEAGLIIAPPLRVRDFTFSSVTSY